MTEKSGCDEHCEELDFSARIRLNGVLQGEWEEIAVRRRTELETAAERPRLLTGLSLSGGGIRSATFNLGLLQALAGAAKLRGFDYFSTVSGGGYVGGWWSAWLARRRDDRALFPAPSRIF